jgi:transforming growth factor-beta-induced protein
MKKIARVGVALVAGTLGFSTFALAPAEAAKKAAKPKAAKAALKDIVDTAVGAGSFKTLAAALTAADLISTLKGPGPFTVFAPTDAAFAKIPKADLDAILADKKKLTEILTYHVVQGAVPASTVLTLDGKSAKTVNGAEVKIGVSGGKVTLNGNVNVTAVDVKASNGIIHVIDTVLLPPAAAAPATTVAPAAALKDIVDTAVGAGSFKTLAAALTAADLVTTLKGTGPFTVFAPTDAAFAKIPKADLDAILADKKKLTEILTYHVVQGAVPASTVVTLDGKSAKTVNGAEVKVSIVGGKVVLNGNVNVTQTDIKASNGIIHVIDTVLLPPAAAPAAVAGGNTIIDVAAANGQFKTLLAAVDAAGLTATLKSAGPFTLFAPNDHAFAVLPQETIASLLKPENKKALTDILTYHVTPGSLTAAQVLASAELSTVNGKKSRIQLVNGRPFINGAAIKITDIRTSNGIIHVIDTVMLP